LDPMNALGDARMGLADARLRRSRVEDAIDEVWSDEARRSFRQQIVKPLDHETALADSATQELDEQLARALVALA
jgi:hypothetical protein